MSEHSHTQMVAIVVSVVGGGRRLLPRHRFLVPILPSGTVCRGLRRVVLDLVLVLVLVRRMILLVGSVLVLGHMMVVLWMHCVASGVNPNWSLCWIECQSR